MKKFFIPIIFSLFILSSEAQNPTQTGQEAQSTSTISATGNKYNYLVQNKKYKEAVNEGIRLSQSFSSNAKYKEAFTMCRSMDAFIYKEEAESGKPYYELHYLVGKERLRMYTNIKKWEQCKTILAQLKDYASKLKSNTINEDFLFTEASLYHTFGLEEKSLAAYKQIVNLRSNGKKGKEIGDTYKQMLDYAQRNSNAPLAIAMRKLYTAWQDSISKVQTSIELNSLQEKYSTTQNTLKEKKVP
jgi:hypothetical protein